MCTLLGNTPLATVSPLLQSPCYRLHLVLQPQLHQNMTVMPNTPLLCPVLPLANVCFLPFVALVSLASLVSPPLLLANSICKPSCTHWGHPALSGDSNRGSRTYIRRKIYEQSRHVVIVFKPPITRGDITELSKSGCAFLLKFCLVFHTLMDAFDIWKSLWQRSLQLNYLEYEEQSPFAEVECVTCRLFHVISPRCPSARQGEQLLLLYVTECHKESMTPLSCLFSRLNNAVLFSCSLYRRYSETFRTFSSLTIFYLGSWNRTEEFSTAYNCGMV